MSTPAHVAIVGAGVFGLSAALSLRARGWTVTVLEPGRLPNRAAASTDVSKIVRLEYGADTAYTAWVERALEGWREWNTLFAERLYHEDGVLLLARPPIDDDGFERASFTLLEGRGHPVERLGRDSLGERHPAFAPGVFAEASFNSRGGWVASGRVIARLAEHARSVGVVLREGESVRRLVESSGRVTGLETAAGEVIAADVVLVAAGAWTPQLVPELADAMWPTAQPVFLLQAPDSDVYRPPAMPAWTADISRTGWYGFPALANGTLKIGHHGVGLRVDPSGPRDVPLEHVERCRAFLREALPGLAEATLVESRLCFYCDTFDAHFWIDRHPTRDGLAVAAGGSGHGFKFAPVLGDLIADAVEGVPNPLGERFRWRSPAAGGGRVEESRSAT